MIVWSILSNVQPYFYKLFIDYFSKGDFQTTYRILKIFIAVSLADVVIGQASQVISDWLIIPTLEYTRLKVFKKIQNLDFAFHVNKSTGSLISAVKRGHGAFWNLFYETRSIFRVIIGFIVILFFFYRLELNFLYLLIGNAGMLFTVSYLVIKSHIKTRREFNIVDDKMSGIITDNLINFETVKFFAKESWEFNRLKEKFISWKEKLWDYAWTFRYFGFSFDFITYAGVIAAIFLGIKGIQQNKLSTGDFIMIIGFIQSFLEQMRNLLLRIRNIAKEKTDLEKYFQLLDEDTKVEDPDNPLEIKKVHGEIVFDNVSFSYPEGKEDALNNFDLKISPGESIALVGESGAGKTTVTKLLLRCYDPDQGRILLDGTDIRNFKKSDLRKHIGVVPQDPILFNQSIEYNIGYGMKNATDKDVKQAAKMALLNKFIESLPKKYETRVGERGIKLSGGQKQRMAIARMILSDPEIIIFDEATSQLDSESEEKIQKAFWKAAKNKTTLIIAHRLSTITRADRIIVMEAGKIVETGIHAELSNNKNSRYYKFWQLQTN